MSIIADSIARIGVGYGPQAIATVGFFGRKQEARSGVNRMWLTQLQEESLRQDELQKQQEKEKRAPSPKTTQVTEKPKRKVEKKSVEVEATRPVFHPLPAFTRLPDQPNYTEISISITQQVQYLIASYMPIANSFTLVYHSANDEEDLELLLLAA